ncbi:MAG: AI-2E family transporter [Candidatus Competibacterales bacterium]|nr:AI-2E family transporter [Candidatus Competibacterales bacterium]
MIDTRIPWIKPLVLLAALVATYWALHLLAPILMPFVLGAALAYLGDPIVDRLEAWKLSRTAGVCLVFGLFAALGLLSLLIFLPMLYEQVVNLVQRIPAFLDWLQQDLLPRLGIVLAPESQLNVESLRSLVQQHWQQAGDLATQMLGPITRSGGAMLTLAVNLFMIPVVTFYLLRDWDLLVAEIRRLIPRRIEPKISELALEVDEVLGAFITGQMLVMLSLGAFYACGLWLAGLDLALLIGLGAGIVSFIPYLGPIVGIVSAGFAMLVQTQELLPLLGVAAVFGIGQVLESIWLTPWLVGDKVGLHPVAVIFAVMAGGQLFGFIGVMLALPVAAALAVLLRHLRDHWLGSEWYSSAELPENWADEPLPEDYPPTE